MEQEKINEVAKEIDTGHGKEFDKWDKEQHESTVLMHDPVKIAVSILNDAFKMDPGAMHALMCASVPVNQKLAEESELYCQDTGLYNSLTTLGMLNGIIEEIGGRTVAMKWKDVESENGAKIFDGFIDSKDVTFKTDDNNIS